MLPRYLYHCLTSPKVEEEMKRIAESRSGTFPQITFDSVAHIEIGIPDLRSQQLISSFLDSLESNIELNRKTNETLEGIAKALFKSWFVDFDPVRAKAEGRPTGLPDEISELFPDSFEESELGEFGVQRGCTIMKLPDARRLSTSRAMFVVGFTTGDGCSQKCVPPVRGRPSCPITFFYRSSLLSDR